MYAMQTCLKVTWNRAILISWVISIIHKFYDCSKNKNYKITFIFMINKLILFKISFRSIVRLLFLFMASNEDPNMKVKKERTSLYFSFLNNVKDLGTIWLNIVEACEKQNKLSKAVWFALKWYDWNSPISLGAISMIFY